MSVVRGPETMSPANARPGAAGPPGDDRSVSRYGDSIVYALVKVAHMVECRTNSCLVEEALSLRQVKELAFIDEHPSPGLSELARHVLTSPQAARGLTRRLTAMGLVMWFEHGDGQPTFELSDDGRSALRRASVALRSSEAALFDELPAGTGPALRGMLAEILSRVQGEAANPR